MTRTLMTAVTLVVALGVPSAVRAHEGHTHKLLGTVASVQGNHAVKVGGRVSVDYVQSKDQNMAKAVKLAEAPAAVKK